VALAQTLAWSGQPAAGSCGVTSGGQIIGAQTLGWANGGLGGSIDGQYGPDTQHAIDQIWNQTNGGSHQSGCMNSAWYGSAQLLLAHIASGTTHPEYAYGGPRGSAYYDFSHSAYSPSGCYWTTDDYHTGLPLGGGLGLGHYVWLASQAYSTSVAGYSNC
jgi:hypothetical protein